MTGLVWFEFTDGDVAVHRMWIFSAALMHAHLLMTVLLQAPRRTPQPVYRPRHIGRTRR